jgi:hypothetical protein
MTFKIEIYSLRVILVLALILCITSELIIIINPNLQKPALAQEQQNKQSALSIVGSMRENGNNLTATNSPLLNANSTSIHLPKTEVRCQLLKVIVIVVSLGKAQG